MLGFCYYVRTESQDTKYEKHVVKTMRGQETDELMFP